MLAFIVVVSNQSFAQENGSASSQSAAPDLSKAPFRNPALPIEQRVNDLVSRMTLDEKTAQMVHTAPAIPRLGIPAYNWWSEGLHGAAREGYATVFPQAIGLAATFDPETFCGAQRAGIHAAQRGRRCFQSRSRRHVSARISRNGDRGGRIGDV